MTLGLKANFARKFIASYETLLRMASTEWIQFINGKVLCFPHMWLFNAILLAGHRTTPHLKATLDINSLQQVLVHA